MLSNTVYKFPRNEDPDFRFPLRKQGKSSHENRKNGWDISATGRSIDSQTACQSACALTNSRGWGGGVYQQ